MVTIEELRGSALCPRRVWYCIQGGNGCLKGNQYHCRDDREGEMESRVTVVQP